MNILGKPQGIFDLGNTDECVGSYLSKQDIKEILSVTDENLDSVEFEMIEGSSVIDERKVQKLWYSGSIPNAPKPEKSSLDEYILKSIIKRADPQIQIESQIRVGRYLLDFKLTDINGKSYFIEFDGPGHFAMSRYGSPNPDPFRKKKMVEDKTGIEVINWPYWIQRCESNVRAIFDNSINGYGVLWSTQVHFGMFVFENSNEIIEIMTRRFGAVDINGFGYIYGPYTRNRNNVEHPIIEKILKKKEDIKIIVPKGATDVDYWIPKKLKNSV